jgi:uncharacterized protein (TIGR04222 family)
MVVIPYSPPEVLLGYSALAATVLAASWLARRLIRAGRNPDMQATVLELAYLDGGPALACHAAMAGLHRAGAVRTGKLLTVAAAGRLPQDVPPLMAALHTAMRTPQSFSEVRAGAEVVRQATIIHRRLLKRGWLLTAAQQRWLRLAGIPGWAVVVLGFATIGVELTRFTEPGYSDLVPELLGVIVVAALVHWNLGDFPEISRAGAQVLQRARDADATDTRDGIALRPRDAMYRVAVRGTAALLTVAPALGPHVGVFPEVRIPQPAGFFRRTDKP